MVILNEYPIRVDETVAHILNVEQRRRTVIALAHLSVERGERVLSVERGERVLSVEREERVLHVSHRSHRATELANDWIGRV
eukprot:SAG25_NODE_23_length_22180_cov_132.152892_18_plen_82_part_00